MKQTVKLLLLVVLIGGNSAKAQDEEDSDPWSDPEFIGTVDVDDGKRADGRMYGGSDVAIAQYPFAVFLETSTNYGNGVIISDNQVLTAASGVSASDAEKIAVRAGSNFHDRGGHVFYSKKYQRHPDYNGGTHANDVAVITIDGSFMEYPNAKPITIQSTPFEVSTSNLTNCIIIGWGLSDDYEPAANVRQISFQLTTDAACTATHGVLPPSVQCVKHVQGKIFCNDAGAPLVCNGRLYGILPDLSCANNPTSELFARLTAPSIQSFLSSVLRRTNYLTCPCQSCQWQ